MAKKRSLPSPEEKSTKVTRKPDEASKAARPNGWLEGKYVSPSTDPKFNFYWNILVQDVTGRENFKPGHLLQLKTLCEMYVDKDIVTEDIRVNGRTYVTEGGRNGNQVKIRPEVVYLNGLNREIAAYTKMLGLILFKDTKTGKFEDKPEDWE